MIVDAKFSVKDKASFVPGELLRFHAAGRTRLERDEIRLGISGISEVV